MTKSNQKLLKVDIFSVSRNLSTVEGTINVADMPQLQKLLADDQGQLFVRIEGTKGDRGLPGANLTIDGTVNMICTRCTKPMPVVVHCEVPFLFTKTEEQADLIPIEAEDVEIVVGSEDMNVAEWVQEEVILSLPAFPKHEDCESVLDDWEDDMPEIEEKRPNPFANLKDLLKK